MNDKLTVTYRGISFWGVLIIVATAIFTILKLIGKITWSWWWVLSPLWIGAIAWVILVVIVIIVAACIDNNYGRIR